MSETRCTDDECTVAQTGICLLNHQPDECPNRVSGHEAVRGGDTSPTHGDPVLKPPEDSPRFPPSATLGMDDVRTLMRKEYCHLIALLGVPDSGKTACLVSLYLLLARNDLNGFTFANSNSLRALDELSRGARSWPGARPEQMTTHTELVDDRLAGFLHFKLLRESDRVRHHLLIPDLPGEWSTSLIKKNQTDRLRFLRAADTVWVMVNGRTLRNKEQHLGAIHQTKLLINRLVALLSPDIPTMRLVVTRLDSGKPNDETLQNIRDHAAQHNIDLSVSHIASFSATEDVIPGTGIADLIDQTIARPIADDDFWPDTSEEDSDSRHTLRVPEGGVS